jgi:SAM-dependent methyltransferase
MQTVLPYLTEFYSAFQDELRDGNPILQPEEQARLMKDRRFVADHGKYPPEFIAAIYLNRRVPAAEAILNSENPSVLDAGCGYGSDSILFASMGAQVLSVDVSCESLELAQKRKCFYEQRLKRELRIDFVLADLDHYEIGKGGFSLTWFSSVLAAIIDQERLMEQVYEATRVGGKVTITDFNLLNPIFLMKEWSRRRKAMRGSPQFAANANYFHMLLRYGRNGARYFPRSGEGKFADVQFFTPWTLARLLRKMGFRPSPPVFSGFIPGILAGEYSVWLENVVSGLRGLKHLGRAYVITGVK